MDRWVVILILGDFAFVACLLWIVLNYRVKRERGRAEERDRLLQRFGSAEALTGFLNSPAGERLFRAFAGQASNPARTIARTGGTGVFLVCLGAGFLIVDFLEVLSDVPFLLPGILTGMAGIGVLIAAAVSARLLGRSGPPHWEGDGGGEGL